jgi:hypothetical protein
MYPPRAVALALTLLVCLGARPLTAQDEDDGGGQTFNPLSAPDQARIEQLLQGFDPNSFELKTQVLNPDGSVQTRSVGQARGLASLQQLDTQRPGVDGAAKTNTNINIFSQAKTNTNINIFREAAASTTNINIFKEAGQQQSAAEINSILQKYVSAPSGPTAMAPDTRLRERGTFSREPAVSRSLSPLSGADQARVEQLLQSFDPNSYELKTQVMNPDGSVQARTVGQDKGLASLQQVETRRMAGGTAKTNTNINIFSQAKTNTNINIFREALAASTTNINIFKDANQQQSAMEINSILARYLTAP